MAGRIVTISERAYTTGVADIEHIESESLDNIAVIRVYIQPTGNLANAIAEITATSQAVLRACPPGTTPPYIIQYSATDVPILEVGLFERDGGRAGAERRREQLCAPVPRHGAGSEPARRFSAVPPRR